jgi:kinetochore protein Nuf2
MIVYYFYTHSHSHDGCTNRLRNQLLKRAAIDHFSLKDLTAPDSIRFKRILSGLINFRLFEQEQAAEYYTPVQQEDEHFEKQEHVLLQKNHALREDIANLL